MLIRVIKAVVGRSAGHSLDYLEVVIIAIIYKRLVNGDYGGSGSRRADLIDSAASCPDW